MDIQYAIEGDRVAGLRFEQFPQRLRARLEAAIQELTERLYARVIGAEPDRTGKLIGDTVEVFREGDNYISGRVRITSDFGKAAALEYGAHNPTKVRAHEMSLNHFWRRAVAPRMVMVGAYTRTPNIAERRFLRGSLEAMRPEIEAELQAAIAEAQAET